MREQLLDSAAQLFMVKGYQKTTITEIARRLGKKKSSFYYYFENKEDLFQTIVRIEAEQLFDELKRAVGTRGEPMERLRTYFNVRVKHMHHVAGRYRKLTDELFGLLPMIESARSEFHLREIELVAGIVADGIKQGIVEERDARFTAVFLVNILKGFEIPMYINHELAYNPRELDQLHQLLTAGLMKR